MFIFRKDNGTFYIYNIEILASNGKTVIVDSLDILRLNRDYEHLGQFELSDKTNAIIVHPASYASCFIYLHRLSRALLQAFSNQVTWCWMSDTVKSTMYGITTDGNVCGLRVYWNNRLPESYQWIRNLLSA